MLVIFVGRKDGQIGLWLDNSCAGDVFVYSYKFYGYISAEEWDINDANVVCRQTGCGFALSATSRPKPNSYYNVVLENAGCLGKENDLQSCLGITLATNLTSNSSIARVICSKDNLKPRLVNGTTDCSGRVEVHNGLSWVSVCGSNWGMNEAKAVCAQLHCGFPVQVNSNSYFGQGSGDIFQKKMVCSGNEYSLFECDFSQQRPSDCTHAQDASVICSGLQLTNGTDRCKGIVKVNNGSQWGSVCSTTWSINEATVTCQELRCGYAVSVQGNSSFGGNQQPILLNHIQCNGWEKSLSQCSNIQLGNGFCNTSKVARVDCSGGDLGYFSLRLLDGENYCSGRLDVYPYNYLTWGTVSGSHWDISDARTVCRYLGCGFALAAYNNSEYGKGSGPVWFEANCNGNETSLSQCPLTLLGPPDTNPHANDAAVKCTGYLATRIFNGTSPSAGRVEVFFNNNWYPVSTEGWDINDANVVCQSQGYGFALAAITDSSLGIRSSSTWFKNFQCTGREYSLNYCYGEISTNISIPSAAAGVICSAGELIVRLVNGTDRCNGILEVNRFSNWERACNYNWNYALSDAVCKELYCGRASYIQSDISNTESQDGIWMNNTYCNGYEASLSKCRSDQWSNGFCNSKQQIRIVCSGNRFVTHNCFITFLNQNFVIHIF
ncbi:scavenger receptor cysteine-rich type 1 protein M130-like [Protopterus annectens]|uniref:scavenger receptor cysteine-rich type 1 protein M130-like n=1 Tax=Protopterus annectens TaxID=7888 RepID=UPI001CF96388|nr:scavenger receptor cysteine-rich type 1 protein M130-like [Protopterus annectens]